MPAARSTIPSSATPSPSEVRIRYFQPASSARALPLKPTSSADGAVVASTSSHAAPRFPASGTASSTAQNAKSSTKYVRGRRSARTSAAVALEVRGRDEHAGERRRAPIDADEQPAGGVDARASCRPIGSSGFDERDGGQRERERAGRRSRRRRRRRITSRRGTSATSAERDAPGAASDDDARAARG